MGVGAAHAERGDARAAGVAGLGPRAGLGEDLQRARLPVDLVRGLVGVQRLGGDPVPDRHDHLDHARDTRGRLRVADVGLDRPQPQRAVAVLAVGRLQRLRLDRVTELGARAVRLDSVHFGR